MPNHVSHKIEFLCNEEKSKIIINEITKDECVDFEKLIPRPIHIYLGDAGKFEDEDFKDCLWYPWNIANWGTKWNAYSGKIERNGEMTIVCFDTAWSIPYPFIIAFANKYGLEFTHKYVDEGGNFWGIDTWKNGTRIGRTRNAAELWEKLHIELKGYNPNEDNV